MNTAKDPLTGETFIKQRNNQVFANRKNQIKFNNIKAQQKRDSTKKINRLLNTNRNILKKILSDEKEAKKSLDFLKGSGFHFGIITHTVKMNNKKWSCVFEYAYSIDESNQFKLIKLKN